MELKLDLGKRPTVGRIREVRYLKRTLSSSIVDDRFQSKLLQLCEVSEELRTLRLMLPELKLLEWAGCIGVQRIPELQALVPAFPPAELRSRVSETDIGVFLWTGMVDSFCLLKSIEDHLDHVDSESGLSILDFGCGCGRLLRYLLNLSKKHRIIGVDVNRDLVDWCSRELPAVEMHQCNAFPPLPLGSEEAVDASIALSVFTHIDPVATREWVSEFARITRPRGVIAITTHGITALERVKRDPSLLGILGIEADSIPVIERQLSHAGSFFHPYSKDRMDDAKAGGNYGVSFSSRESIVKVWESDFELVGFDEGGVRGWQDVSILRRRA